MNTLTVKCNSRHLCFQFRYILYVHFLQLSFRSACSILNMHFLLLLSHPKPKPQTSLFVQHEVASRWPNPKNVFFCYFYQPATTNNSSTRTHTLKVWKISSNFSLTKEIWKWKYETENELKNHNPDEHEDCCFSIHLLNVICVSKSAESIFMRCHKSNQITKR